MPDDLVMSKDTPLQVLATDADGPLDAETVRNRWMLLWSRECDFEATSKLLTRYLAQPLSDSETAWAYIHLANSLAVTEHAAEAVHETFERWLPGMSPRLSPTWPYHPAADGSPEVWMGPDEIRVTFLGQSAEFATAYAAVGRYADYVAKADATLAGLTSTPDNLEVRFYGLLIFMTASQVAGDFERAEQHLLAMHAIADQAEDASRAAELHAFAVTHEIQLARARNDSSRVAETLQQALLLLDDLEKNGSPGTDLAGYRQTLAHHLTQGGQHDLAQPLLDANLSTGGHSGNGYAWLTHAAAVWQVTRDRPRAPGLLREARAHDGRDLVGDFQALAAFRYVKDDPESLQAISRSAAT